MRARHSGAPSGSSATSIWISPIFKQVCYVICARLKLGPAGFAIYSGVGPRDVREAYANLITAKPLVGVDEAIRLLGQPLKSE